MNELGGRGTFATLSAAFAFLEVAILPGPVASPEVSRLMTIALIVVSSNTITGDPMSWLKT